ncbi:hypothetical protein C8N46_101781 [Kordia periserrulae]|uniref:Uncharacterized protein n=1 Tax=Kordia periserrulae TaxID=701523 RepID=A0A2T6C776_9FLAO|nr:hypothetical protein [Kordia periserrulae]PTX64170.1 hypothetical protein C8N46_101781 [Kordia periserrulae]
MKKRIHYIVCILLMLISVQSFAHRATETNLVVTFEKVKKGHELVIKDANLLIVYKEVIQKDGNYSKGFDLTALPDGEYTVELDKDVQIVIIPFTVSSNTVTFQKENETVVYKPMVRLEGNHLFVSKLSLDAEPLQIKLYYTASFQQGRELIFKEEVKNTKIVERVFQLSKEEKGKYMITFQSQGRTFTEYVNFR